MVKRKVINARINKNMEGETLEYREHYYSKCKARHDFVKQLQKAEKAVEGA